MADAQPENSKPSVTIRDVARAAEVHISTVSRALDPARTSLVAPATKARVLAVAEELGYRPHLIASGLRRGQTRTVGVVVPDLGNPLYAPLARGVAHALDRGGYMPMVADTQDDHRRLSRVLHHLLGRRVDAVIMTAARAGDRRKLLASAADGVPVVLAIRTLRDSGLPCILHDDAGGGRLAAEHLLELGHRRLAQVRGPADVEPFVLRSAGFEAAVREAGADVVCDVGEASAPTDTEGQRVMRALLEAVEEPPTAVFVHNDALALGALKALRAAGLRCPHEVSVVGYNDVPVAAHSWPPLTTIRLPAYDIGRLAGGMAIDFVEEPERQRGSLSVPASLVVRESTSRPRR